MQKKLIVHFPVFARHEREYMFPRLFEVRPWAFIKEQFSRPPLKACSIEFDLEKAYVKEEKKLNFKTPKKL